MPNSNGVITGNAILGFQGRVLLTAMKAYLESNGKMQLTRIATPSNMTAGATAFTGKTYKKGRKALVQAYADMQAVAAGKNLDELGETHVVNEMVGGVAAALGGAE